MKNKQALELASRILAQSDDHESPDIYVLAEAIAFLLKTEYGHHNYYNFTQSLNAHLYGN